MMISKFIEKILEPILLPIFIWAHESIWEAITFRLINLIKMNNMKKYFIILLLCLVFGELATAFQNEPEGFRDLKWGQLFERIPHKNEFRELKELAKKNKVGENIKIYYCQREDLMISGRKMLYINYYFWKNKFYQVQVLCTGIDNYLALLKAAEAKFGKADWQENNTYFSQQNWEEINTKVEIMLLRENEYVSLDLTSIKLEKEMRKDTTPKPVDTSGW